MKRFGWILVLAALAALAAGPETRPSAGPETRPTAGPQTRPTTQPVDAPASSPKEALRSLNLAQRDGDAPAIISLFTAGDEQGRQLVAAMADYSAALAALHRAAERVYGPAGAIVVTGDIQAESASGLAAIDKAEVTIEGDTASVKYSGATDAPIKLVKTEGRWRLPVAQLLDGADAKAEEKGAHELLFQSRVTRSVADDLGNGHYKEGAEKARGVWRTRLLDQKNPSDSPPKDNPKAP